MRNFGIDVSVWQKGFNFELAKREGAKFAILRGAYHLNKDKCFEEFYKSCKELKIPVGVYHYSMAKTVEEAKAEANFLIEKVLKGKTFEYPIYFDVEDATHRILSKKLVTDITVAYCETLEAAGYYVGIYTFTSFFKTHLDESRLTRFDKWVAQWASKCGYDGAFNMWQFGGETNVLRTNKVAGMVCDQNYCFVDYPTIIKNGGFNGYKAAQSVVKKSVDELAKEVLNGSWGVGEARKQALEKAGYNYKDVQARVNKILEDEKLDKVAKEVLAGKWGNGSARKRKLASAGYDANAVQKRVNELVG